MASTSADGAFVEEISTAAAEETAADDGPVQTAEEAEAADDDLTEEQRQEMLKVAMAAKDKGNEFFKAGDNEQAIECYSEAIDHAPPGATELAVFYANRAAAYAKVSSVEWTAPVGGVLSGQRWR